MKRAHLRGRRDGRAEPPLDVVQRSADRCDQILANLREQLGRCVRLVLLIPRRRCVVPDASRAHRRSPREKLGGHRGLRRAARVSTPLVLVRVPHRVVVSARCVVDSRRLDRGGRDVAALAERGLRDHAGASARGELRLEPSALRPQLVHLRLSLWRSPAVNGRLPRNFKKIGRPITFNFIPTETERRHPKNFVQPSQLSAPPRKAGRLSARRTSRPACIGDAASCVTQLRVSIRGTRRAIHPRTARRSG